PVGNAALGIRLQHIFKDFLRRTVPKRMLVQHRPVKKLLRFRFARRLEVHLAELAVVHLAESRLGQRNQRGACERDRLCVRDFDHDFPRVEWLTPQVGDPPHFSKNQALKSISVRYVRYWPKADIPSCTAHVRFRGEKRTYHCTAKCPLITRT